MHRKLVAIVLASLFVLSFVPSTATAVTRTGIVGGTAATEDYPFMASMQRANGRHFCGGSLVAKKWVLTAAHCVDGEEPTGLQVMLGSHFLSKPGEVMKVSEILVHESYNSSTSEYDIALVKLTKKSTQTPIRVAALDQKDLWSPGTTARVLGWGTSFYLVGPAPDELHEVDVPVVSDSDCATPYEPTFGFDPETMVCAGEDNGGKDSCQGDSGGPLMVRDTKDNLIQMGTVSFGLGCGFPFFYGVYGRVGDDALRPWLSTHIGR